MAVWTVDAADLEVHTWQVRHQLLIEWMCIIRGIRSECKDCKPCATSYGLRRYKFTSDTSNFSDASQSWSSFEPYYSIHAIHRGEVHVWRNLARKFAGRKTEGRKGDCVKEGGRLTHSKEETTPSLCYALFCWRKRKWGRSIQREIFFTQRWRANRKRAPSPRARKFLDITIDGTDRQNSDNSKDSAIYHLLSKLSGVSNIFHIHK